MNISIAEFAAERNQDRDTVTAWIRKHPDVDAATFKKGRDKFINTECEEYKQLDKQYPFRTDIVIQGVDPVEHKEVRDKLDKAQELIQELYKANSNLTDQVHNMELEAQETRFLLENKSRDADNTALKLTEARNEVEKLNTELLNLQERLKKLENRGFLDRLLNRKE